MHYTCIQYLLLQISLSPLFAVSNLSPFDLTLTLEGSQLIALTTYQSHSETLLVDKGKTVTFSSKCGPDVSYNVGLHLLRYVVYMHL